MPTIDDLREVLVAREVHAGDADAVLLRLRERRRAPRRMAPLAAAAFIAALAAAVSFVAVRVSEHHSNQPATRTPIAATNLGLGPLVGEAVDPNLHTITFTAELQNDTTPVTIDYPIQVVGSDGAAFAAASATVTNQGRTNRISSSGPAPAQLTELSPGQTALLWVRMHLQCSTSSNTLTSSNEPSVVIIRLQNVTSPVEVSLAELFAGSHRGETFASTMQYACSK